MKKRLISLCLALAVFLSLIPQISTITSATSNTVSYEMRKEVIEFTLTNGTLYYKNTIEYPYFTGSSAAEVAINNRYAALIEKYKNTTRDFDAEYEEMQKWNSNGLNGLPFYDNVLAEITYCDNNIVSIKESSEMWGGGNRSYMDYKGCTYRISDGQELALTDILGNSSSENEALISKYKKGIVDNYGTNIVMASPFVLTDAGLCFMVNVGDSVPREEVVIPHTEIALFDTGPHDNADGTHEYNGHRYKLITEEKSWKDAEAYCVSLGGHLVTITSEEENSFIQSLINKSTMIGLSDAAEEGAWSWVTGESLTYTNWAKNEPNNQSNEDYVLMQVKGTWNDGHLDREKWPFVCEWDGTTLPGKTYSVEEIEQMVANYFNTNYQDASNPGKYVVFHGETSVTGNKCSIVVRFQSSSNSPNTAANVLFAYVSVNMETGVMTIEGVNGDTDVQLFYPSSTGDEPVVIPEPIDNLSSFNKYFVENYYDNLNTMYQYDSVAADILSNSSSFQINWNSCLSALSNKEFLDVLKFENHPEYYYQTVLFESIMQTKLNDDYWSALTSQIGQVSLDAVSYYVKYDANFTSYEKFLKQKLNTTMTDFSVDSVQYKRLSDYYGQYCNQLKTYDTVKDIYDLTVKADGTVEDFFNALSNYACIYNTTEEIISALEYLKLHLEGSANEEDQYILTAVNNILASLDRTLNEQLVLNCLGTAKDLLWGVFWAAISDAFPGALALDIASFTIDSGLALSNVFFPTTISADSYCKLYADYAIEVVTREAFQKAYTDYSTNPSDELATVTVGLYDLLGYTYAHEIEVAAVLSEQLHKDGLINGLKNLFSSKNIDTYEYEQDCIEAYEAYLNEITAVKVEAQKSYGLAIGTMQPVITVYFVNGKVAAVNDTAISTGDIYHVSSGEFPLPDFVGLRIEIEGYYLDQQFNTAYEETAINKPLSLYCNLLLTKAADGTPVLFDHSTGISVSSGEKMVKHTLTTAAVTSGTVYASVEEHFTGSEFELYDISLLENGVQVQPSGEVTVEIPANPDYANQKTKVYHVTANGEFEDMNATSDDDVLQFTTTHFSYFVVVYENTESAWLIPLIIAVVVCGAGVSLFFILKTRKKKSAC